MSKSYLRFSKRSGLEDTDILDIRFAAQQANIDDVAVSVRTFAKQFGMPKSTIHDILTHKTWSHVPTPKTLKQFKNYMIFPDGRIYSTNSQKFMTTKLDRSGNINVELSINGKRSSISVASLIAKAFLGKKNPTKLAYRDNDATNVHFTNIVSR